MVKQVVKHQLLYGESSSGVAKKNAIWPRFLLVKFCQPVPNFKKPQKPNKMKVIRTFFHNLSVSLDKQNVICYTLIVS